MTRPAQFIRSNVYGHGVRHNIGDCHPIRRNSADSPVEHALTIGAYRELGRIAHLQVCGVGLVHVSYYLQGRKINNLYESAAGSCDTARACNTWRAANGAINGRYDTSVWCLECVVLQIMLCRLERGQIFLQLALGGVDLPLSISVAKTGLC